MKPALLATVLFLWTATYAQQASSPTAPNLGGDVKLTLGKHPTDPSLTRIAAISSSGTPVTFDSPDVAMKYSPDALVLDLKDVTITSGQTVSREPIKFVRLTYRNGKFAMLSADSK